MKIDFLIDHIDPLGQGVSKLGDKITFIPKTLPEESGQAFITKESKGVRFAAIESPTDLTTASPKRVTPKCPHFDLCPGCHLLHTDYETELEIKNDSLRRHFKKVGQNPEHNWEIKSFRASSRHGYRNRIQLHYDRLKDQFGMINPSFKTIIPIPNCIIATDLVLHKLVELYKNDSWKKIVKKEKRKGHIEIYQVEKGKVKVSANRPYSSGGFTQVNEEGNQKLLNEVLKAVKETSESSTVLDLFGGKGNLSRDLAPRKSWVIDATDYKPEDFPPHQQYVRSNLFDDDAPSSLYQTINQKVDVMLVDPPRSGVKNLTEFTQRFEPSTLVYVSCNPATLTRDLATITDKYRIEEIQLHDFFPGTFHFESLCILQKKI